MFKSYYVVWKLSSISIIFFPDSAFKSYYVVWKPDIPGNIKVTDIGLNRTMQYGNEHQIFEVKKMTNMFKSYYVVWKLIRRCS